jgi:hypothetical protein
MKTLSNLLGQMWEADPNKSIWSLITKAWSTIRDQIGKDEAPLDQFLRIVCPQLNIASPETYLDLQRWNLSINEAGVPVLSRDCETPPSSFTTGLGNMTLSVEEIIALSQDSGYAQGYKPELNASTPTFLGRPPNQGTEKNTQANASTQAGATVPDYRVAARNKRRAKRQSATQAGVVAALQQQIVDKSFLPSPKSIPSPPRSTTSISYKSTPDLHTLAQYHSYQSPATMNTEPYDNLTHVAEPSFSFAEKAAMTQFEAAFTQCTNAWRRGNNEVVLQDNLQVRFDAMLLQYFQRKLIEEVGVPVALTFSDSNSDPQTLVQMPQPEGPQAHPQTQSRTVAQTETSEQTTAKAGEPAVGAKKAPRPMNCWIIFRDRMHKKLKGDHPVLSVQQICKQSILTLSLTSLY